MPPRQPPRPPEPLDETRTAELRALVDSLTWTFAKTYAKIAPHEYTVRAADDDARYFELFEAIQRYGQREQFGKYWYRYLYLGDGWKYWAMTTASYMSRVLNRAKVHPDGSPAPYFDIPPEDGV